MLGYILIYWGFMNFLLRLFKKEKHNIGVIRFGDNLVIPGR